MVRISEPSEAKALSLNSDEDTFVYIVDDDPGARESVAALVQSRGMQTKEYASAEEFLAVASEDLCGCLVLDVRMKGMGGLDLQDELHRRDIPLPVIVITGYADVPRGGPGHAGGSGQFPHQTLPARRPVGDDFAGGGAVSGTVR